MQAYDMFAIQDTLTRHKPMVAEYLEANYDKVSLSRHSLPALSSRTPPSLVLQRLRRARQIRKLRHKTTITQTPRRDSIGPNKFQSHDSLHRQRGEPQNDDEFVEG